MLMGLSGGPEMTDMPKEIFAYPYGDDEYCGTGTWIDFDDSCHKLGDVATQYIRKDIVKAREDELVKALEWIKTPSECGCLPICLCTSQEVLKIELEEIREFAKQAIIKYKKEKQ